MKRKTIIALVLVAALAGTAGTVAARKHAAGKLAAAGPEANPVMELADSELYKVNLTDLKETIPFSGALRPVKQAFLRSQVAGKVGDVLVREGRPVTQGETLAQIDVTDLKITLQQRKGDLGAVKAQLALAEQAMNRQRQLVQNNSVSKAVVEEADSNYQKMLAMVQASQALADSAEKAVNDATITAPISGMISTRNIDPGDMVALNSPLFSIIDLAQLEIEAAIPASQISSVSTGQDVEFRVQGMPDAPFIGKVERINPETAAGSRSVPVYVLVSNEDKSLRSGMFVTGTIVTGSEKDVLALPSGAVREAGGGSYVMKLEGGVIRKQEIQIKPASANSALRVVQSGLRAGDVVVSSPFISLDDKTSIQLTGP